MIATDTGRLVGAIRTECAVREQAEAAGSPPRTDYRPHGTPLLNDGRFHYWMQPGEDYAIDHDGTGWRVTCGTWPDDHTYRLATATWELTDRLPVGDGFVMLDPTHRHVLRYERYAWILHEL
jgi:hypothetical protein